MTTGDTVARGTNLERTREFNRRAVLDVLRRSTAARAAPGDSLEDALAWVR